MKSPACPLDEYLERMGKPATRNVYRWCFVARSFPETAVVKSCITFQYFCNEILSSFVGVVFEDGTEVKDIHGIIFATGYKIGFPCLDEGLVPVEQNEVPLYKYVFPYEHKHHTMAILGCLQPIGAVMPLSELQARWAVKVFNGRKSLPSNDEMKMEMAEKKAAMRRNYYKSERHTIQV